MTHEAIIEKVKKKYAGADEATIHAVLQILQEAKVDLRWLHPTPYSAETTPHSSEAAEPLKFVGEHLTLEQYRRLSLSERGALKRQLKQQNREWLEKTFSVLRAAWIMVMDGEIIAHGSSLKDYPSTEKIREIGTRHGKRPFLFVNDLFVAIEESHAIWHPTIYDNVELRNQLAPKPFRQYQSPPHRSRWTRHFLGVATQHHVGLRKPPHHDLRVTCGLTQP